MNRKDFVFSPSQRTAGLGWLGLLIALAGALPWAGSAAAELAPGTVIDAANLDALRNDTFETHPISELIPPSVERMLREYKLRITLKHSEPPELDPRYVSLTQQYSPAVRFNRQTRQVENYVAGTPFPDIRADDPDAGYKVMFNTFYFASLLNNGEFVSSPTLLIDARKGLEQVQEMQFGVVALVGRVDEPHVIGDGNIVKRELTVFTAPYDIRGVGTYTVRYADGRPDETSAYLRSVRRIRRLTGGAWMDPVGGTDYLYDDINGFNGHPSWYRDFRYVGRQWVLGLVLRKPPRVAGAATPAEEFPLVDLKNPPYWNPVMEWEPIEVHVVEAIPPPEHPYSRKVYYYSVALPGYATLGEFYDRQGALWKVDFWGPRAGYVDSRGRKMPGAGFLDFVIDIKNEHASVAFGWDILRDDLKPEDVTVEQLLKVAK